MLEVIMEDTEERNVRKRKANESSWKRNQIKYARIKGEEYKGRHVPARKTGPACRMNTNATLELDRSDVVLQLGWIDYLSFCIMIAASAIIGLYFGYWGKKEDIAREYLHGGKNMGLGPVSASLSVSIVSGLSFLGTPTEIYTHGSAWCAMIFGFLLSGAINYYFYLPVYYDLQLTSSFEYMELRFHRSVRVVASFLSSVSTVLFMPIHVYVPALALNQVTGVNVHYFTIVIVTSCVVYTTLGGIKGVMWTDLLQALVMVASVLVVVVVGLVHVGGFAVLWERNLEGGRLHMFDMDPSPFKRATFWSAFIGFTFITLQLGTNQQSIQRYISLPTFSKARASLLIYTALSIVLVALTMLCGLLVYAEYYDCDPLKSKKITKPDQMIIYYVMSISRYVPGLTGFFMAGVLSAALSTMSSMLNSLAATVYPDFIRPYIKNRLSEKTENTIMKCTVAVFGAISIGLVVVIGKLGLIAQAGIALLSVSTGTLLGLFSLGMFCPRGNYKGALAGSIVSLILTGWMIIGAQNAVADGRLKFPTLPTTASGCGYNDTSITSQSSEFEDNVFILFKTSFLYYSAVGFILVFIVGVPVSMLTEPPNIEELNPSLFPSIVRKKLIKKTKHNGVSQLTETVLLNVDT